MGETVTITLEEYRELMAARTRLNILVDWIENHKYVNEEEVKHILGIWKGETK